MASSAANGLTDTQAPEGSTFQTSTKQKRTRVSPAARSTFFGRRKPSLNERTEKYPQTVYIQSTQKCAIEGMITLRHTPAAYIHIRRRHLCVCLWKRFEFPTFKKVKNKAYSVAFSQCCALPIDSVILK